MVKLGEEQLWRKIKCFCFVCFKLKISVTGESTGDLKIAIGCMSLEFAGEAKSMSTHLGLSIRKQVLFQSTGLYKIIREIVDRERKT